MASNRTAAVEDLAERRGARRWRLLLRTRRITHSKPPSPAIVRDLSRTGCLLESTIPLAVDERIDIDLPHAGCRAAVVVWSRGRVAGCDFLERLSPAALSAALLRAEFDISPGATVPLPRLARANGTPPGALSPRARLTTIVGAATSAWILIGCAFVWLV